jgi:hypothetical protein
MPWILVEAFWPIRINFYQTTRGHILENLIHTRRSEHVEYEYAECDVIQRTDF